MKKSSIIIIAIVTVFAVFIGYKYINDDKVVVNEDGIKFKNEYESLNNRVNSNNNKLYPKVSISKNNVVKYSSYDEVLEILKSGSGVIYFGYPECPWCRNLVPVLLSAAKESELDTIYYLNIKNDRDLLILDDESKIKTEKEGSKKYFELLKALDSILDDYVLTSNDGKEVSAGHKRIYVPLVVFVKDGKIIAHHTDTVSSQKDPYVALTDREEEELLMDLINKMNSFSGAVCDDKC